MNRITVMLLLGCALLTIHLSHAQDGETDEASVEVEAETAEGAEGVEGEVPAEGDEAPTDDESTEDPNANGQKSLALEDMQLWSSIDLDKNGKLTINEFDRFVRSPSARAFVNQMKGEKAVKAWADRVGIDVAKAKQAMAMGARANARRSQMAQLSRLRRRQLMQQQAMQRRRAAQMRSNNYFANIGRRYYRAMSRSRRDEL